jgi:hypothetical protein
MSKSPHDFEHVLSQGDLLAGAMAWLDANGDAPVAERAAMAVVVETGGDQRRPVTLDAIAERAGASPDDVIAGLCALKDAQAAAGETTTTKGSDERSAT